MKLKYLLTRDYFGVGADPVNFETALSELGYQDISNCKTLLGHDVGVIETALSLEHIEAVITNSKIKGTICLYRLENPTKIELGGS